jgi:pimeloyl-ACP methyl ester carboxylesterase
MARRKLVPPSRWADLNGPVHHVLWEGPEDGPVFVLVHGLGGSLLNWLPVAPGLAEHGMVHALDLAGFGRTPLDARSATPHANRDLVHRFIEEVVGRPSVLVGNSMGGWISIMEGAIGGPSVAGLILTDPAVPRAPGSRIDPLVVALFAANAVPGLGELVARERARRTGPEGLVRQTMKLCTVDPSRIDPEVMEAHIELAKERAELGYAVPAFLRAARTLVRSNLAPKRTWQMVEAVSAPTLVIHGAADRLVSVRSAQDLLRRRPDWTLRIIRDVGHVPQLEAPGRWLEATRAWLADPHVRAEIDRRGAVRASA